MYLYPALFVMVISPLGHLHPDIARHCWTVLNLLFLSFSLVILYKSNASDLESQSDRRIYMLSSLIIAVNFRPITAELLLGNVDLLILLVVSLGFYHLQKNNYFKSGIFIGIGASIKVAPILIVLLYFMKKKYIAILVVITTILLTLLLPAIKYGVNSNLSQIKAWVDQIMIIQPPHPYSVFFVNQSVSAVIYRYLSHVDCIGPAASQPLYVNIVSLSSTALQVISGTARLSVLFVTLLTLMLYRKRDDLLCYQYSLILMTMPLISSVGWVSHYVVMLVPILVPTERCSQSRK